MEDTCRAVHQGDGSGVKRYQAALWGVAMIAGVSGIAVSRPAIAQGTASGTFKISIPYQGVGVDLMVLWTAIEQGLFKKYSIDATTEYISQSPVIVASMLSGEILFANVGQDAIISADLNGGDVVVLAAGPDRLPFIVYAAPSIHSVADLKGKRIGISSFGTTTDFVARYVLTQAGLNADKDATLLPVGTQANRLVTLRAGATDATIVAFPGNVEAKRLGFNAIADMADYDLRFYTGTLAARRSWVEVHRAETLNVLRGYIAGIAAVFADKPAALSALAKYAKTSDPEMLESGYQALMKVLKRSPMPDPAVLKAGLETSHLAGAKTADPKTFIDASFVDELQRDGFIDGLYNGNAGQ
jgi:NitT/TauT family transport system substrate-binding protein